ncbi:MAG: heme o synthase [Dehalococcoidales bacterium]|nr:heme o synthase [Dehalococcoidales bacterium]
MKAISWSLPYLSLLKLRIVALLVIVAIVAALIAGAGDFSPARLALLALVGGMACAGASVLNNYLDRDIDAVMPRTRNRPIPRNKVSATAALVLGLVLLVVSLVVAFQLGSLVVLSLGSGALIYVVLYTMWLKRRTSLNIIIGGLSGSCVVLAGWFAITHELSPAPFLIALIVFLWTPGHFWSFALVHQESYRKASIPMLPNVLGARKTAGYIVLHSALLMITVPLLYFLSPLGLTYLTGALFLSTLFLASGLWLWRQPGKERAWRNYKLSGLYLLGLFVFMLADVLS